MTLSIKGAEAAADVGTAVPAPASVHRIRLITWGLFGVLATLYYLVLNATALPASARLILMESIYCTPIAITVVLSIRSRALAEGTERAFWGFLAGANAILLACEALLMVWVFAINPAGPPRVSWPFHIMHGVAAVCFIGLLLSMTWFSQASLTVRIRWVLDSLALIAIAGVVLLVTYVEPLMSQVDAPISDMLLGVAYPLFGLTMIVGTFGNVVGMKVDRWRIWDKLVAISLTLYAVAISLWPLWYTTAQQTSRNYERGLLDLVQFGGHWMLMLAALYRVTEPQFRPLRPLPPSMRPRLRNVGLVVPIVSIASLPLLAWAAYRSLPSREWFMVYAGTAVLITLLLMARSVVVALENGALFHRSVTDPLTGLYNHRFFHDRLAIEIAQATRYGESLSVIAIDIDDFGEFNEHQGHLAGDRLLVQIARLLGGACPSACVVARLGGDEFAVMMPRVDADEAAVVARRMLDVVAIQSGGEPGTISASAGVASYPEDAFDAEQLLKLADGALFDAKGSGKATVVRYHAERVLDLTAQERIERLERQNRLAAVRALAAAVDARDTTTQDHSRNVAHLARGLADAVGMGADAVRQTEIAALLHDVGKIGVPDAVLNKIDPLDSEEKGRVREHAVLGQQILASASLEELTPIVRSHHEWWDGTGYPDGLAEQEIPVESRILAICDAYDSMVADRAYRKAMTSGAALEEIDQRAGTQFDPLLSAAFIEMVKRSETSSVKAG